MKKLHDLREYLLNRVAQLKRNPDQLLTFVEDGNIRFHSGDNLSHSYSMPISVIITDWRYSADELVIPILEWLRVREPGFDPETALSFESEVIDKHCVDIAFRLNVTERVIVKDTTEGREINHILPEPPLAMNPDATWTVQASGPGESFQEPTEE